MCELGVTARFRAANLVLAEDDVSRANGLYTEALAGAGPRWRVHTNLLNNRGITWLQLDRVDLAVADFTAVIDAQIATDEIRTCALNNRTDLFTAADDLVSAIADKTSLLALTDTSFDRRYIALSRRARERWALDDRRGTFDDLETVLKTDDIVRRRRDSGGGPFLRAQATFKLPDI